MSGFHGSSYRGRNRHEHKLVPVPREVRAELIRSFLGRRRVAVALGVSEQTADALMSPYGVVRPEVLERVRARLAEARSA